MALSPYLEDLDSQIPAIQVLHALGWNYLGREEAVKLRNGRLDQVVLTGILKPWLEQNNQFEVRGESHPFSEANIAEAIRRLLDEPYVGLVRTNESIYHLLALGTSLDQTVEGDRKGRQLHFVDWKHPENNAFHVTDEFVVERTRSHETCRPDLVLFVNGIPFVVAECKRRDQDKKQIEVAIEQQIRNQRDDWIPKLFQYAQLLIGTSVNETRYGTIGTPRKLWLVWREEGRHDQAVHATANHRLPADVEAKLFAPKHCMRKHTATRGSISSSCGQKGIACRPSRTERCGRCCVRSGCSTWRMASSCSTRASARSLATSSTSP